jgi:hypothetical protein
MTGTILEKCPKVIPEPVFQVSRGYLSSTVPSTNDEKETVLDVHPPSAPPYEDSIIEAAHAPSTVVVHPVIFDSITGKTIRSTALRTTGVAGPSGIDARGWRRLCTSFKTASDDLCHSLARRLSTVFVDPGLAPLMSCC